MAHTKFTATVKQQKLNTALRTYCRTQCLYSYFGKREHFLTSGTRLMMTETGHWNFYMASKLSQADWEKLPPKFNTAIHQLKVPPTTWLMIGEKKTTLTMGRSCQDFCRTSPWNLFCFPAPILSRAHCYLLARGWVSAKDSNLQQAQLELWFSELCKGDHKLQMQSRAILIDQQQFLSILWRDFL